MQKNKINNTDIIRHNTSVLFPKDPVSDFSEILNNSQTKADYVTNLSVHLINLLLNQRIAYIRAYDFIRETTEIAFDPIEEGGGEIEFDFSHAGKKPQGHT